MKILVRSTNWVGDSILTIPALEGLRARHPDSEIVLLARPWVADLFATQPFLNRVITFDHTDRHRGFFGLERLASELRRERFDTAILFQNAFQAAWLAWRAGIPHRIGYARDARSLLLSRPIPVPAPGEIPAHETRYYLELLRRAGLLDSLPQINEICLRVEPAAITAAEEVLLRAGVRAGKPRLALAPGAAYGSAKCWPPERFAAVADRFIAEYDADVILFGTISERPVAERISSLMRHRPFHLIGQTPIRELPAFFSACSLFLGNDSGAMHVAAAVGLPGVAVFGSTDPYGTAPVSPRFTVVQQPVSCSPCFLRHCPIDHRCMTRLETGAVFTALRERMAASAISPGGVRRG